MPPIKILPACIRREHFSIFGDLTCRFEKRWVLRLIIFAAKEFTGAIFIYGVRTSFFPFRKFYNHDCGIDFYHPSIALNKISSSLDIPEIQNFLKLVSID